VFVDTFLEPLALSLLLQPDLLHVPNETVLLLLNRHDFLLLLLQLISSHHDLLLLILQTVNLRTDLIWLTLLQCPLIPLQDLRDPIQAAQ
jgi:hypothetical protein